MRKASNQLANQKSVLTLSEGKWQEYCQKVNYVQELENFAGLLYICKLRWNLEDNHQHTILLQIADIKFAHLMKLSLQSNNIQSIEPISKLFCPKLVELQLGDNKITSIKALRRCDFQDLKVLSLRKNMIIENHPLQQICCVIRNAFLEWYDDFPFCSDISWCLKLETFQLKNLLIQSRSRIIQLGVLKQIKNKFPSVKLSQNRMKLLA